jgi:hypothetical protein
MYNLKISALTAFETFIFIQKSTTRIYIYININTYIGIHIPTYIGLNTYAHTQIFIHTYT